VEKEDDMLRFEGNSILPGPAAVNAARLKDATYLVKRLPDLEKITSVEPTRATFTLRPGLSFVRGTLEVKLEIREEGDCIIHYMKGKSIGSTNDVEARMTLSDSDGQTRLDWVAEVKNITGLLKAVPQGLIKAAAQKVIADTIAALQKGLSEDRP
jgi:carbon monoxide dehydrogenase subunit G